MKSYILQIVIFLLSCFLLGCAGNGESRDSAARGDEPRRSDCIYEPSIRGYKVLDEENLIVDAGRRSYHVTLAYRAYGLDSSWAIVFDTPSSRVCAGFDEVRFRGPFDERETVRIRSIRELTPEEEEHLLIRYGKRAPEIEQTPTPQEVEGADVEELDTGDDE